MAILVAMVVVATVLLTIALKRGLLSIDQVMAYAAFLFVASAAPVGLAVLVRRPPTPAHTAELPKRPAWLSPMTACMALSIGMVVLGLVAYGAASDFVTSSVRNHLEAVATLKATLVQEWVGDGQDDIRIWSGSPEFYRAVDDWHGGDTRDAQARQRLVEFLQRLSKTSRYIEVSIRDSASGALLLTTSGDEDSPAVRSQAIKAANASAPLIEDLHSDGVGERGQSTYVGFFAGVTTPGAGRIVLHVGIDPEHEFYPLIEELPGSTSTADLLLVRRDGDAMVVLKDSSAHRGGGPLRRLAIGPGRDIGTKLAKRASAFIRGDDDRGHRVLAFAQPVVGTSWTVVAKVDESEAFAQLNRVALLIATGAGGCLLLAAWWWVEHRRHAATEQQFQLERSRQSERLSELSRRVVSVQEEDRRRLASELHDRTGANLAAIKLNLQSIAKALPARHIDVDDLLKETSELLTDTIVSIREFCGDLRPSILDYAGLAQAIENSIVQFKRRTGISAELDRAGFSGRCAPEVESVLFRIAQEALLNSAKHSSASCVHVRLAGNAEHLTLVIEDDGVGFDPALLGLSGGDTGSGILNMRERAAFAGATFTLESAPGRGTCLIVELKGAGATR